MKRTVLALATAAFFTPAVGAYAQSDMVSPAMSMLELAVTRSLASVGIEGVDMASLTLGDLTAIKAILDSDDNVGDQRRKIEQVIAGN